jgi:hypothetical protein
MKSFFEEQIESTYQEGVSDERERVDELLELLSPETTALIVAAVADGRYRDDIVPEVVELTRAHAQKQKDEADALWARIARAQEAGGHAS